MITEDYVSYKTAKLLKEKGFDIPCRQAYFNGSLVDYTMYGFCDGELLDCPSQSIALKWLREVHKLFVEIVWTGYENMYSFNVTNMKDGFIKEANIACSYNEAAEEAILYVLKNLI